MEVAENAIRLGRFLLGSKSQYKKGDSDEAVSNYRDTEGPLFHIGMVLLILGYTFCFYYSVKHSMYRYKWCLPGRILLFLGHFVLVLFGGLDNSEFVYIDYVVVNVFCCLLNGYWIIWQMCNEKPITLHPSLDRLWEHMFGPDHYNLEKYDFYNLVQERAELRSLRSQEVYFGESDVPTKLSILVDGKMVVFKTDDWGRREVFLPVFQDDTNKDHVEMIVGEVDRFEFIDSFEWLSHGLKNHFAQVTIKAEKECIVVSWDYDVLKEIFKDFPRLRACVMAMVGKDVAQKLLSITGRSLASHNEWCDIVRRKDSPFMCWRDAGIKDVRLPLKDIGVDQDKKWHPAFDMDEISARLRIANARMLAMVPSPLENLQPSAGVSSNAEHGAKLLNFFRRVVPDLPQRDLHELIKWGKWREYRKQFTQFLRKGEQAYYVGVVLDGQLDVLDEYDNTAELTFKHSIKEFELVGSEDFGSKSRSRSSRTIRVASHGAVLFVWDTKDLTRLMLADPRVESVISTLLRGDITLKLRDSQSLTNRVCGDLDAVRRDGEGRALCSAAIC
jgi:CRP-like cAMP-binding protein